MHMAWPAQPMGNPCAISDVKLQEEWSWGSVPVPQQALL